MSVFFPYGLSNFAQVVSQGYVYVDKTEYIALMEKQQERFIAYLRPRRFGKSLFLSTLEYYYDIAHKERFEELFSPYYIGQHPTPLANSYRILSFNFSGIDTSTREGSRQGFNMSVRASLKQFCKNYAIFSEEEIKDIFTPTDAEKILTSFFRLYTKEKIPIYLLIDEYDHFTNEILLRDIQEFKESISLNGYVRKFYEVIKNATQQGVLDRLFITGVSPITLDNLTSGFNILKHLTHDELFEPMMGFSNTEVHQLLKKVLPDHHHEQQILSDMKHYYNGYKFSPHSTQTLYNSDMVLYFLDHFKKKQTYPRQMLDPNIMPDYGKLKQLFEVANWTENTKVLEEVLRNGVVSAEQIFQFSFEQPFGRREFVNLLYYMGNLTIEGIDPTGITLFRIPNKVIAELYWQYYAHLLQTQANLPHEFDNVQMAVREMALTGHVEKFLTLVEKLLKILSNRDYQRFDEKYVKMAMIAYAMQANIFWVQSERELQGGRYIDLELYVRPNNPHVHHQFAIEVKYLKKEQESRAAETMKQAKEQLLACFQTDTILKTKKMLHLLAVVVVKDAILYEEVNV